MEELIVKVYSASTGQISVAAYGENGGANGHGLQCKYRQTILVVLHTEKMEELMGKVYSASTGHISGEAYGENGRS
jgi:hypothetical protein